METHFGLGVVILSVLAAAALADPDIKVTCLKDSVKVIWRVGPQFVPYAARFFLGSCMPSRWTVLPTGEGEAHFNYKFTDCKFTKQLKGKHIMYQNELSFRPQAKPKPAVFEHPIKCVYKRPEGWVPKFLNPGAGASSGQSKLVFHMALLNEQLTGVASTNVFPLGSFMPIWAAVEQKAHQPLLLLMDECVAATTPELQPGSQVYPIIANNGCLLESRGGSSMFLPRYHSSAIILYLQSFKFGLGGEVYIHCNLIVWDSNELDQQRKACHVKEHGRKYPDVLGDGNYLMTRLGAPCVTAVTPSVQVAVKDQLNGSHSRSFKTVLGPIIIVDEQASVLNATSLESGSAFDNEEINLS